nr:hypothetical protein [Novosphingobium panipatense]
MASESLTAGSVYDILYSDTRRLSSLLSQFSDDGIITELTRADEAGHTSKAGLSIKVISGDTSSSGKETKSQKIDPQWLLPLLFLDEAQHLIHHDLEKAPIGSVVLIKGKLIVTDLRIIQKLWSAPSAKKTILQQIRQSEQEAADAAAEVPANRAAKRAARAASKQKSEQSEAELVMELLPLLPHSPQVNIVGADHTAWATVEPDYIFGSIEDLMLKHGAKVAGTWAMVGILDGRPFEERADEDYDDMVSLDERVRIGMFADNIWKLATELAFPARQALGRPFTSFGITPLVIFREVEQPAASELLVDG